MRHEVLAQLKSVSERLGWLNGQWKVKGAVYDFDGPRDDRGNVVIRPRGVSEYPENNAQDWENLAAQSYAAMMELEIIREHALKMAFGLRHGGLG